MAFIPFTLAPDSKTGPTPAPWAKDSQPQGKIAQVGAYLGDHVFKPIGNAMQSGADEIQSGFNQPHTAFGALQGGLNIASGLATGAGSFFAPLLDPFSRALAQDPAKGSIIDHLVNSPDFQKFAMSSSGQLLSTVLSNTSKLANVAGATAGVGLGVDEVMNPTVKPAVTAPVSTPEANLSVAETARTNAASAGVNALEDIKTTMGAQKTTLGENFAQGAAAQDTANPNIKFGISHEDLAALNDIRENKNFALPDILKENGGQVSVGGKSFDTAGLGKNATAQINAELGKAGGETATELTRVQTQDLITKLDKATFQSNASGDFKVNQQLIDLTNRIKTGAAKTFGSDWQKLYSNYSDGITAVNKLNDLFDLNRTSTASDQMATMKDIQNLGKTEEGKIILSRVVEEFKAQSGIDLTDPVKAIHQIADKQMALEDAQAINDKAKAEAAKGTFGQRYVKTLKSPEGLAGTTRFAVKSAISLTVLYPLIKAIKKELMGQ